MRIRPSLWLGLFSGTVLTLSASFVSADYVTGTPGDDTLFGNSGHNVMSGRAGDDKLYGLRGLDRLIGNSGDDWLDGGARSDRIEGGLGDDHLIGGNQGGDMIVGGPGRLDLWRTDPRPDHSGRRPRSRVAE